MGKYAILMVFFMTIALYTYNMNMNELSMSTLVRNTETYNTHQARNIANSAVQALLPQIINPDNEHFTVQEDQIKYYPESGYYPWEELNGNYKYQIENKGDTLLIINSTGLVRGSNYSIEVRMAITDGKWNPQFPLAVFAEEDFEMTGSARIVWHAGTNSIAENSVRLTGMATIDSALYIGPGGNPNSVVSIPGWRPLDQAIGGGIRVLNQPYYYPLPEFPEYPAMGGSGGAVIVQGGPANDLTLDPTDFDNLYFNEISIRSNRTLTMNLGSENRVIRVGKLDIRQGHLVLEGTGSITFYVEDEYNIGGSSTLNQNGLASQSMMFYKGTDEIRIAGAAKFKSNLYVESADIVISGSGAVPLETGYIISGGDNVTISGAGSVHGSVIYAPKSHVRMTGSGNATAAIISETFLMTGNPRVYYPGTIDEFPDFDLSSGANYVITSWN